MIGPYASRLLSKIHVDIVAQEVSIFSHPSDRNILPAVQLPIYDRTMDIELHGERGLGQTFLAALFVGFLHQTVSLGHKARSGAAPAINTSSI
ncbi:hypothetical protein TZ53_13195 [Sphingobium sp. YBL2]|nr:hypothetical protein TZ53_13195 [Sphingobium sp. YBL2]